jgi:multiple sugar transport system permease protein
MASATAPTSGYRSASEQARLRRRLMLILTYVVLVLSSLLFAFPLFWTVSSSLQTWQELRSYRPHLLPAIPQWINYPHLFAIQPMARWLLNSFVIIALSLPGGILSATMTAYAFARFRYPGRETWFIIMLGTMMIPSQVLLIPQYLLFFKFGWINTYYPLTVPSWFGGGAFTIFLLRQFIMSIPRDLDEAALMDGAGPIRILWQVLVPLMQPAITTVAVLGFLSTWNDFFGPFIYLNKAQMFTAAVGLQFLTAAERIESTGEPRDHLLMAAAAVMSLPVVLLFIFAQRYFVQGVVLSGIKM